MTIAEFKRKLIAAKDSRQMIKVQLFKPVNKEWELKMDMGQRRVSVVQSNSYAFETIKDGKATDSWADWPKSGQLTVLPDGKIEVNKGWSKLVYEF